MPYRAVLRLERRASHEGMVSVGGNLYSLPDTTRRRVFEVHVLADEVRIFEDGALVATHAPLEGRGEKRLDPSHRKPGSPCRRNLRNEPLILTRAGDRVVRCQWRRDFPQKWRRKIPQSGGSGLSAVWVIGASVLWRPATTVEGRRNGICGVGLKAEGLGQEIGMLA